MFISFQERELKNFVFPRNVCCFGFEKQNKKKRKKKRKKKKKMSIFKVSYYFKI